MFVVRLVFPVCVSFERRRVRLLGLECLSLGVLLMFAAICQPSSEMGQDRGSARSLNFFDETLLRRGLKNE